MSIFKRLSATITSRVDQMVGEIENHDAVIETAIRESRRNTAQAKVRLNRIENENRSMQNKLAELKSSEEKWKNRAREHAQLDENKALECLRRAKANAAQHKKFQSIQQMQESLIHRLRADISQAEQKLLQLTQQRSLMRSRQSTASALNSISLAEEKGTIDVTDTMERWEAKILEAEMEVGSVDSLEDFEYQFEAEEEVLSLKEELAGLLKQEIPQPDDKSPRE